MDKYQGLFVVLAVLIAATIGRAVSNSLGVICVARQQLSAWIASDALFLIVLLGGCWLVAGLSLSLDGLLMCMLLATIACVVARSIAVFGRLPSRKGGRS